MKEQERTDEAWNNMRRMLDQDMPVREKRRPVAAWWWFSAASLTALVLIFGWTEWLLYNDSHPTKTNTDPAESALVWETLNTVQHGSNSVAPLSYSNNQEKGFINTSIQHSDPDTKAAPQTYKSAYKSTSSFGPHPYNYTTIPKADLRAGTTEPTIPLTIAFTLFQPTVSQTAIQDEPTPLSILLQEAESTTIVEAIKRLPRVQPMLHSQELPDAIMDTDLANAEMMIRTSPNPYGNLRIGLSTGMIIGQVREIPGFMGGPMLDYSSGHSRFGIRVAALYRFQQLGESNRPVVPVSYDNYVDATNNTQAFTEPRDGSGNNLTSKYHSSVLVPLKRVHRMEIPLLLSFKVNKILNIYGGSSFARVLSARTSNKGLSTYTNDIIFTPNAQAGDQLNATVANQLPNWEKSWQLGFGLMVWRQLELGILYRKEWGGTSALSDTDKIYDRCIACKYNFESFTDKTSKSLRPDAIQVNLSYRF